MSLLHTCLYSSHALLIGMQKEKPDINVMDELAEFHGISKYEMERRVKEVTFCLSNIK